MREVGLTAPRAPEVRLRDAAPSAAELAPVYDRVRVGRPGWSSRDERWWSRLLLDPPDLRDGHSPRRALIAADDEIGGYALWRTRSDWVDGRPRGAAVVAELVASTPRAYAELWRFLLSVDLRRTVSYWFGASDEPLTYLVEEARALGVQTGDALWVRLIDVPAALSARRYAAPVDVVLDVSDALLPENAGRWRLSAGPSGAGCTATTAGADLACDVADLGAAYLGGASLATLAAAGRVRELRPRALGEAGTAFGWHRAPSAIEIF